MDEWMRWLSNGGIVCTCNLERERLHEKRDTNNKKEQEDKI